MNRLSAGELGAMQRDQHRHDMRNHFDILSLHKTDRLKHYGLHYCKYAGRFARGTFEEKSRDRTIVDVVLVALSAANTLHQDLRRMDKSFSKWSGANDQLLRFIDAAGRFADACEKIDHLEDFIMIARKANLDIIHWVIDIAESEELDIRRGISNRRNELAERPFYIE